MPETNRLRLPASEDFFRMGAMRRPLRARLLVSGGLALLVGLLLTVAYLLAFVSTLQIKSNDLFFSSREDEHARQTVIVGIDQRSYRELLPRYGPLVNWPRMLYARVIETLRRAGARVIALDIFFDAPKPEDPLVAAAIRRVGNVIIPVEAQGPRRLHPGPGVAQEFDVFVRPTETIKKAVVAEGTVNVTTDRDTVVRSLPLLLRAGTEDVPALALTTVARFIRRPTVLDTSPTDSLIYGAGRAIPILETGSMLINYLGPPSSPQLGGPFTIIPFVDILNGAFDRTLIRDKIVLIGLTIRGLDEFSTPSTAETRMWGVEVLGNEIETILSQRFLLPAPPAAIIGLIFTLALLAALLVATTRPIVASVGTLGLLGIYIVAAGILFENGTILNLVYPPAALLLGFTVTLVYRVVFEQTAQQELQDMMERYLSPAVSRWVLSDPHRVSLGGESRTMTVLFCDLRGFTTLSHTVEPQIVVSLLNEFMTAMTDIVFTHYGVLDKYIGDALMAFWNAPMDQPDHARRACETALDIIERLHELHADWKQRGVPLIDLGIGINTGPMVVGNMGSRKRLAYTVVGDTVNVASRLEGLSKEYGIRAVVGESVRVATGTLFEYRFLDIVAVKGRSEPLEIYELVGRTAQLNHAKVALLQTYQRGMDRYHERHWAKAAELFREAQAQAPGDGPSALYLSRSDELLKNPPPADWDFVYVAKTK